MVLPRPKGQACGSLLHAPCQHANSANKNKNLSTSRPRNDISNLGFSGGKTSSKTSSTYTSGAYPVHTSSVGAMAQSKLFSFFKPTSAAKSGGFPSAAKPAPPKPAAPKVPPKAAAAAAAAAAVPVESAVAPQRVSFGDAAPAKASPQKFETPSVGRKLRIWDKDEARWQAGKVTAEKAAGLVRVCYDSGEEEELELGSAKYEWVEDTKKPSADTNTKKKPTKRAIVESESDEEVDDWNVGSLTQNKEEESAKTPAKTTASSSVAKKSASTTPASAAKATPNAVKSKLRAKSVTPAKKSKKASLDSDEEFNDSASEEEEYDEGSDASMGDSEDDDDESDGFLVDSDEEDVKPKKAKKATPAPSSSKKRPAPSSSSSRPKTTSQSACSSKAAKNSSTTPISAKKASAASPASPQDDEGGDSSSDGQFTFMHSRLEWFSDPNKVRDASGLVPGSVGFNKRTLKVSEAFMCDCSPAQTQWWDIKRKNLDLVIMMKIGKFYEMYHSDADIGVKECNLSYMKGDMAHCGFPELSYGRYAEVLASKGYRCARVEQTETVEENNERKKTWRGGGNKQLDTILFKNTRREICSILSSGTRTYSHFDNMNHNGDAGRAMLDEFLKEVKYEPPTSTVLLSIKEVPIEASKGGGSQVGQEEDIAVCEYGVCLVDCPTGSVMLGQFRDDALRTRLKTLLAQFPPAEVLLERSTDAQGGGASEDTVRVVEHMCAGALVDDLKPDDEFWTAERTADLMLQHNKYFACDASAPNPESRRPLPPVLAAVCHGGDAASLALSALGAATWVLDRAKVDDDVISMGRFSAYVPPDLDVTTTATTSEEEGSGEGGSSEGAVVSPRAPTLASLVSASQEASQGDDEEGSGSSSLATEGLSDLYWVVSGQRAAAGGAFDAASTTGGTATGHDIKVGSRMLLDGTALTNLEVLLSTDGEEKGSLFKFLNRTSSPGGKRLLKDWVCAPLLQPKEINARLDAVSELCGPLSEAEALLKAKLKRLPDLEKLLLSVHALGSKRRSTEHPDSRARIFDADKIDKGKVAKLADLLEGMKTLNTIVSTLQNSDEPPSSVLLKQLLTFDHENGLFPDLTSKLAFFAKHVDMRAAKATGFIEPRQGMDADFDAATAEEEDAKQALESVLSELKGGPLRGSGVKWFHHKTKLDDQYQLEIPQDWLTRHPSALPAGQFVSKSQTSKGRRFHTNAIVQGLKGIERAQKKAEICRGDAMRKVFAKFAENADQWSRAIRCIATLDALSSLAAVSSGAGFCRPTIVDPALTPAGEQEEVVLDLEGSRHPSLLLPPGQDPIPNNTKLGGGPSAANARMLLLTGPNMGGKSTLLRQTCLVAIVAQMGCFVPCASARLSPIDRIFTRLGASDRILAGQSTFFVELSEAAAVLRHATHRSLVILDELGRGTSTFDGTAIAHAVVDHLANQIQCRALFATHYHSLVEEWGQPSYKHQVSLGHMACVVGDGTNSSSSSSTSTKEEDALSAATDTITFLYTLEEGSSPRSFGVNVARLAKLPQEVLALAATKSAAFEDSLRASTQWQATVELGKRLLLAAEATKDDGGSSGGRAGTMSAGEEVLAVWQRLQQQEGPAAGSAMDE